MQILPTRTGTTIVAPSRNTCTHSTTPSRCFPRQTAGLRTMSSCCRPAREAGVSKTAVSFAFNSPERLSTETAIRIREVADTLGYRPNPVARMLTQRQDMGDEELAGWVSRFCKRKWNSEFSCEMSRSCAAMVAHWLKKE